MREPLKSKDVRKRLSPQYSKDDCAQKATNTHLEGVSRNVLKDGLVLMDGTGISKKRARFMEGPESAKNRDTPEIGLGHNVLNIDAIDGHKETIPLYGKAHSYEMGL